MERKTTVKEETMIIYDHFKGQKNVKLCKLKKFVLEEMIFSYTVNSLRYFEKEGKITKDSCGQKTTVGCFKRRKPISFGK